MKNFIKIFLLLNIIFLQSTFAEKTGDFAEYQIIRNILKQHEDEMDLAKIKLSIDKLIEPKINIKIELQKIEKMLATIKTMLPPKATDMERMLTIKKYLYEKGEWNNNQVYHYDFNDPLGTKMSNKLLPNYMATKKGNCISMPFLFIILGDKLGINVTASTAPLHVFVKFTDTNGKIYNLETTSGANFTRSEWIKQQMPMTDKAIENGIYLQLLTKKETVAVMATIFAEYLFKTDPKASIAISELILKYYPKSISSILRNGSAYYLLLQKYFLQKYPNPNNIPQRKRKLFHVLANGNQYWFNKADKLGWVEPKIKDKEKYLEIVKRDAKKGEI